MERCLAAFLAVWYSSPSPSSGDGDRALVIALWVIFVLLLLNLIATLTRRD